MIDAKSRLSAASVSPPGATAVLRDATLRTRARAVEPGSAKSLVRHQTPAPSFAGGAGAFEVNPAQRVSYLVRKIVQRYAQFPRSVNKELSQLSMASEALNRAGGDADKLVDKLLSRAVHCGTLSPAALDYLCRRCQDAVAASGQTGQRN